MHGTCYNDAIIDIGIGGTLAKETKSAYVSNGDVSNGDVSNGDVHFLSSF